MSAAPPPVKQTPPPTFRHAYRSERLRSGNYAIRDLPVFAAPKDEAKGKKYTIGWLKRACRRAEERKAGGFLAPAHIEHHDPGQTREFAGFMDNYRTALTDLDGENVPAVFVDLLEVPPAVFEEIRACRLPYRSVEILDPDIPELSSLALMKSDVPFFRLPVTVVTDPAERFCFRAANSPRSRKVTEKTKDPKDAAFAAATGPTPDPQAASAPPSRGPDGAVGGELKDTFADECPDCGESPCSCEKDGFAEKTADKDEDGKEFADENGDGIQDQMSDDGDADDMAAMEAFLRSRRMSKRMGAGSGAPQAPAAPAGEAPAAAPAAVARVPYRAKAGEDKALAYMARLSAEIEGVKRQLRARSDGDRVKAALSQFRVEGVVHSADQFKAAVKELGLTGPRIDAYAKHFSASAAKAPPRPGEGPGGQPAWGGRAGSARDQLSADKDTAKFAEERDPRIVAAAAGHARYFDACPALHNAFTRSEYVEAMVSNDKKTLGIGPKA